MATTDTKENHKLSSQPDDGLHLHVCGGILTLDKKLMISRSGKLLNLIKANQNRQNDAPYVLAGLPGDSKTFELAIRFCYGYEVKMTSENVVPLICLAHYLEMTDEHSPNNLVSVGIDFFKQKVLPAWNESLKALRSTEQVIREAVELGIVGICLDSLVQKARASPRLLGEPIHGHAHDPASDAAEPDGGYNRVSARRRLFLLDWQSEELTMLSLQMFEILMSKMIEAGIRPEYIAASLFRYLEKGVHLDEEGSPLGDKRNHKRDIVETVEKLLPNQIGVLPCKLLFEMLRTAILLEASAVCRFGLENRIGKQLKEATVDDLLVPFQGYASELQYDTNCVKRILKVFYDNYATSDQSGLIRVADLIDEFLAEVARESELKKDTFASLLKLSIAASAELARSSDGMYRAIDVYLDKHGYLTESEREEVCQALDCYKLSSKACTHAAQNERLPLRVVVQTLFAGQLQLRDAISNRIDDSEEGSRREENEGDETKMEMEQMDGRVMELEKECLLMKKHMENGGGLRGKKLGVWKKLKRKFGCMGGVTDCDSQMAKGHHAANICNQTFATDAHVAKVPRSWMMKMMLVICGKTPTVTDCHSFV